MVSWKVVAFFVAGMDLELKKRIENLDAHDIAELMQFNSNGVELIIIEEEMR